MHLLGHNFTGPGTKLDNCASEVTTIWRYTNVYIIIIIIIIIIIKTLKVDGTPKSWSRPINRVDSAAYRHDLAYARHADTVERIVCNKVHLNYVKCIVLFTHHTI